MNNNFFQIGKSQVNFCEPDFYVFGVGEFYNVLSSFAIVFFGLYGLYKINFAPGPGPVKTKIIVSPGLNILYLLLVLIGLGSVYFHYELSPFAHWVDIIFISMILLYSQYILAWKPNINIFQHKIKYLER